MSAPPPARLANLRYESTQRPGVPVGEITKVPIQRYQNMCCFLRSAVMEKAWKFVNALPFAPSSCDQWPGCSVQLFFLSIKLTNKALEKSSQSFSIGVCMQDCLSLYILPPAFRLLSKQPQHSGTASSIQHISVAGCTAGYKAIHVPDLVVMCLSLGNNAEIGCITGVLCFRFWHG